MSNLYTRQFASFMNEMRQSCGALVGIVQGILADGELRDAEIRFLNDWLAKTENVALTWPGSAIYAKVSEVLADGRITAEERDHLLAVLQQLVGGKAEELAEPRHVSELPLDQLTEIDVPERIFCFTGDFVFGPRSTCEAAVSRRGGQVSNSVTKKLHYLVVGGMGSPEWKHGSFGTKIVKAIEYRHSGAPVRIVHEDVWASSLRG